MQKGVVVMDVVNREQARIAEDASAVAVMALEAVLADIHRGCDGIFVGSGVFSAEVPASMGDAIVQATNNWDAPDQLAEISKDSGNGMRGDANVSLPGEEKLQGYGV